MNLASCSTVQSVIGGPSAAPAPASVEAPPSTGLQAPVQPMPAAPGQASRGPAIATFNPVPPAPPVSTDAPTATTLSPPTSPSAASTVPAPAAPSATPPANAGSSDVLSEDEALGFYQDVMLTYAFDACGLPLLGAVSRQDIVHRLDICPAPAERKSALRVVLKKAIADAERDPAKTRAAALSVCADKRAFLRSVMSHANELTFDDTKPPNCDLISPPSPPRP